MNAPERPIAPRVNFDAIPAELQERPQWVCWRYRRQRDKWTKRPLQPTGAPASTGNPATWTDFATARAAVEAREVDGLGFVFTDGDPYVGIDLDDCFTATGELREDAADAVARLCGYTEVSPSGHGLHIIVRSETGLPGPGKCDNQRGREMYDRGRFFTVTGQVSQGHGEIVEAAEAAAALYREWLPGAAENGPQAAVDGFTPGTITDALDELPITDEWKDRIARGAGMDRYLGEDGQPDRSAAVLAACMTMLGSGVSEEAVLDVLTDPAHFLARAALDRRGGNRESAKQWVREYGLDPARSLLAERQAQAGMVDISGIVAEVAEVAAERDGRLAATLALDAELTMEDGSTIKVRDYWVDSSRGRLRVQAPFGDADGASSILDRDRNGLPFVFDNGTRCKYVLPEHVVQEAQYDIAVAQIQRMSQQQMDNSEWLPLLRPFTRQVRRRLVGVVQEHGNYDTRQELLSELAEARREWEGQDRAEAARVRRARREAARPAGLAMIEWDAARLADLIPAYERALYTGADVGLFTMGGQLVEVARDNPHGVRQDARADAAGVQYPSVVLIRPVKRAVLRQHVMQRVITVKPATEESAGDDIMPPLELLDNLIENAGNRVHALANGGAWAKRLDGILSGVAVLPDGQVLSGYGYHEATGLFLCSNVNPQQVDESPEASLEWLKKHLFGGFAFARPEHQGAALCMLSQVGQAPILSGHGGMPGALVNAALQGEGKSTLVQAISLAGLGRPVAASSLSRRDDEENRKFITSALLAGLPLVMFDNVAEDSIVEVPELAAVMTGLSYRPRQLGGHQIAELPSKTSWFLTGNRIGLGGDFATRFFPIFLDSGFERPDLRVHERPDLLPWIAQNRAEVMGRIVNVLKAQHGPVTRGTRFPAWDAAVYRPYLNAGGVPLQTLVSENLSSNPTRNAEVAVVRAVFDMIGATRFKASDLLKLGDEPGAADAHIAQSPDGFSMRRPPGPPLPETDDPQTVLADALEELDVRIADTAARRRKVGYLVRKLAGRTIAGLRIEKANEGVNPVYRIKRMLPDGHLGVAGATDRSWEDTIEPDE